MGVIRATEHLFSRWSTHYTDTRNHARKMRPAADARSRGYPLLHTYALLLQGTQSPDRFRRLLRYTSFYLFYLFISSAFFFGSCDAGDALLFPLGWKEKENTHTKKSARHCLVFWSRNIETRDNVECTWSGRGSSQRRQCFEQCYELRTMPAWYGDGSPRGLREQRRNRQESRGPV